MKPKTLILLALALGSGLFAVMGISQASRGSGQVQRLETARIYVALRDIEINEEMTADNVKLEDWPKDRIPEGAVAKLESLQGRYAKMRLFQGEPVLAKKLVDEANSSAEKRIPDGFRAISVKVNATTSVSGLILPGSRVDVLCTFRASRDIPQTTTKTILRDVRVFAVNSQHVRDVDANGNAVQANNVTLLVTPKQAEKLMLATTVGHSLSLMLRSPDEQVAQDSASQEGATLDELLRQQSEVATVQAKEPEEREPQPQPKFAEFMASLSRSASGAAAPSPAASMMVLSGTEGPRKFVWTAGGHEGLPQEVSANAPDSTLPPSRPGASHSAPSVRGGGDGFDGFDATEGPDQVLAP